MSRGCFLRYPLYGPTSKGPFLNSDGAGNLWAVGDVERGLSGKVSRPAANDKFTGPGKHAAFSGSSGMLWLVIGVKADIPSPGTRGSRSSAGPQGAEIRFRPPGPLLSLMDLDDSLSARDQRHCVPESFQEK